MHNTFYDCSLANALQVLGGRGGGGGEMGLASTLGSGHAKAEMAAQS